jgi:DNA-binding NarL/FixJ family response regulator
MRRLRIAIIDDAQDYYLKHGVQGIVSRNIASPELVIAIGRVVVQSGMYVQKRSDESAICSKTDFVDERVLDRLTLKELQIVACILRGYKNREIALELGTTEQVGKNYLRSVFDKTGVSDRLELALFTVHHSSLARAAAGALTRSEGEHLKIASRSPRSVLADWGLDCARA